ncbi:MAG TPA: family 10 glycosylhydrolase, partial [Pyrinomonadaceae bacterium]|nr:family 10 glycosylhydrolase [Pyrinomonadaceae bacterium]
MKRFFNVLFLIVFAAQICFAQNLPKPEREFRAAWIATVDNIDFPSSKNLTVEQQKTEIIRILDFAKELKLNAVVFQVRPHADAFYDSKIEPWSEYLTGKNGVAPEPLYDPLRFVVEEAHRRGILVHAWFNPYRAWHPAGKSEPAANHISKTRPDLVRKYGKYLWLDPTEPEVQKLSADVIADVVRRYDIDGAHFDDYFYPYPEKDAAGNKIEFPDDKNWQKYKNGGGRLTRDDWRRKNVDDFIQRVSVEIKKIKPDVMFGVSPFGIWQPVPERNIAGFDAYAELYADARKWFQAGWVDYLAPQLYWQTTRKGLEYPVLFDWWQEQNKLKRHLWTGVAAYRAEQYTGAEIAKQVEISRQ